MAVYILDTLINFRCVCAPADDLETDHLSGVQKRSLPGVCDPSDELTKPRNSIQEPRRYDDKVTDMRRALITVIILVIITRLTGKCWATEPDIGIFKGTINGADSILVLRGYPDTSKLEGYKLTFSKYIFFVAGHELQDRTWSLVEYDGPGKELGPLTCKASATNLQCRGQSGYTTILRRLDVLDNPIDQIKTQSEEFARRAFEAAVQRRFRDAVYYLKLYRVTNVNHPFTQNWESLFEAEENNTVSTFYDDAIDCKDAWNCRLRQEPLAFIEAERKETEKARNDYRAQCRENNPSYGSPPPFTCLMYAAFSEEFGDRSDVWQAYDLACPQLSFACSRAFGPQELQLISDIARKQIAAAHRDLLNTQLNVNGKGGEALLEAVSIGSTALVQALLARGANPNLGSGQALRKAAFLDEFEILRLLLDHGADPNLQPGESALEIAIERNNVAAVKELIEKGAAINYNDYVGVGTALMDAVETNNINLVSILLDAGADPTIEAKFHDPVFSSAKNPTLKALIARALLACHSGHRVCAAEKNKNTQ